MKTAVIPDTNVFIHDPDAIQYLSKEGFFIYLPWVVILELDKLKTKPDKGVDAREALRNIEEELNNKNGHLEVFRRPDFKNLQELEENNPDHRVIATAKTVMDRYHERFAEIKILSRDRPVRILANELGVKAEDYLRDVAQEETAPELKTINAEKDEIKGEIVPARKEHFKDGDIIENEGVICYSDYDPFRMTRADYWEQAFAAIKMNDHFQIVPNDIGALGITPFSYEGGGYNWEQHISFAQLLNTEAQLFFLAGGPGSGKTVVSLASAIALRANFRQILISRPMIPLEDEDRMGFLPGPMETKISPWLKPVWQALDVIKYLSGEKKMIEDKIEDNKIDFIALDYLRGASFYRDLLIIDDAQNLTPHQVKTIITRIGQYSKVIFTGDLGQIDRKRRLDRRSSGLAYAKERMKNNPLVAITDFKEVVRSPLSKLAEERL